MNKYQILSTKIHYSIKKYEKVFRVKTKLSEHKIKILDFVIYDTI